MAFAVRRHHGSWILIKKAWLRFSRTFFLYAHCLLFTLGELPARLVGFVLFCFIFLFITPRFFTCTLISAPALSIFSLILQNSKAGWEESKLSLQKANTNYLTTSVRKHLDVFGTEMAEKYCPPDSTVLWHRAPHPFSPNCYGHEQTLRFGCMGRAALLHTPWSEISAVLKLSFFYHWLWQDELITSAF